MRILSEQLLRKAVEKAEQKKQQGLLIWLSRRCWNDFGDTICEGNEHYEFALAQVSKDMEATITYNWFGIKIPAIYAVSVQKMKNSEEYFQTIMDACTDKGNIGPIIFIPSHEVAECFE